MVPDHITISSGDNAQNEILLQMLCILKQLNQDWQNALHVAVFSCIFVFYINVIHNVGCFFTSHKLNLFSAYSDGG